MQTLLQQEMTELGAYPTLLKRAAETGNTELYRSLLTDALNLVDELSIELQIAERKQRIAGTPEQTFAIGFKQGSDIVKSETARAKRWA